MKGGLFQDLPESADNFPEKRRNAMKGMRFGNRKDLVLSTMFDRLGFYDKQINPLWMAIRETARDSEDVNLHMLIP